MGVRAPAGEPLCAAAAAIALALMRGFIAAIRTRNGSLSFDGMPEADDRKRVAPLHRVAQQTEAEMLAKTPDRVLKGVSGDSEIANNRKISAVFIPKGDDY